MGLIVRVQFKYIYVYTCTLVIWQELSNTTIDINTQIYVWASICNISK